MGKTPANWHIHAICSGRLDLCAVPLPSRSSVLAFWSGLCVVPLWIFMKRLNWYKLTMSDKRGAELGAITSFEVTNNSCYLFVQLGGRAAKCGGNRR